MRKRRKGGTPEAATELEATADAEGGAGQQAVDGSAGSTGSSADGRSEDPRANGPWDSSEQDVDPDDQSRMHLGGLSVRIHPDLKLHFQVDQGSGEVTAVMLIAGDGAMELRVYAAPRHEDLWDEFRTRLAEEAAKRGGKSGEVDGPFGKALHMVLPATTPEGKQVAQPSTILGISGPRWLLRVTMFGRPAAEWRSDGLLETVLRSVVVNRGSEPMAPGDTIPLVLPASARRVETPD